MSTERERIAAFGPLEDGLRTASDWYWWGPYVSERQWATVREDYSPDGDAWNYLPHDHARSRAYRWGEDGLAGFCDIEQRLCLGVALWNGRDPILKERLFGLNGSQGNHGEDAKEYWWYLDAVPSHAWNHWRYHYPQAPYPYEDLLAVNGARGRTEPEYELLDTGLFDEDRYWVVDVLYAKSSPTDLLMEIDVTNAGPEAETLDVLPTAWFRNTWSWEAGADKPTISADGNDLAIDHPWLGPLEMQAAPGPDGAPPHLIFCENETNVERLFGATPLTAYPKDGINDYVIHGARTVNPQQRGTKAAFWYRFAVAPGETVKLKLRLRPPTGESSSDVLGTDFDTVLSARKSEADEFYHELAGPTCSDDEAMVMRQAFAGLLWSKQFYFYDVNRWLDGDPLQPPPPEGRSAGRNARWRHMKAFDIMSMPDKWEYPWFAAWDLAFHCVTLAHLDPAFAKYQLILLCREWFQHPNGALPAYEWDFGDVNPPVQAWAALEVFAIDGGRDLDFLSRILDKLMINFTWWVNREDADGSNLFEGGFLGLDNIGPIDRSHLPQGDLLQQADATGWMGFYALTLASIAAILNRSHNRPTGDLVVKFIEHFTLISRAMDDLGLYDEEEGMYFDRLHLGDGTEVMLKVHSIGGIIPLLASVVLDQAVLDQAEQLGKGFASYYREFDREALRKAGALRGERGDEQLLLGMVSIDQFLRLVARMFEEREFLSPYGLRALSAYHRESPYVLSTEGVNGSIDYEPAESTTPMFGGNSNWRGPIWYPVNYLVCSALERYGKFLGSEVRVAFPSESDEKKSLADIAQELRRRNIRLFLKGDDGRRPIFGTREKMQTDPKWGDNLLFNEYFNGDTGEGLGASHQTGWTGLVADQIRRIHNPDLLTLAEVSQPKVDP